MRITIKHWFKGAPENRPGGPWWRTEFNSEEAAEEWLESMAELLYRATMIKFAFGELEKKEINLDKYKGTQSYEG